MLQFLQKQSLKNDVKDYRQDYGEKFIQSYEIA